jgi:hypothetical protein
MQHAGFGVHILEPETSRTMSVYDEYVFGASFEETVDGSIDFGPGQAARKNVVAALRVRFL